MRGLRGLVGLAWLLLPWAAVADNRLEVIALRHLTVEQAVVLLRPHVEPGGVLNGMNGQLIVRTSPANLRELRGLLERFDVPARRLLVSVRLGREESGERDAASVSGRLSGGGVSLTQPSPTAPAPDGLRVEIGGDGQRLRADVGSESMSSQSASVQRVQVMEGGRAHIRLGSALPLRQRQVIRDARGTRVIDSSEYREAVSGFVAIPQVSGERVTLDLEQMDDAPAAGGEIRVQRIVTRVAGRLGEWIEVGGIGGAESAARGGWNYSAGSETASRREVYIRVDVLP